MFQHNENSKLLYFNEKRLKDIKITEWFKNMINNYTKSVKFQTLFWIQTNKIQGSVSQRGITFQEKTISTHSDRKIRTVNDLTRYT